MSLDMGSIKGRVGARCSVDIIRPAVSRMRIQFDEKRAILRRRAVDLRKKGRVPTFFAWHAPSIIGRFGPAFPGRVQNLMAARKPLMRRPRQ
jgi:hypothetical protein